MISIRTILSLLILPCLAAVGCGPSIPRGVTVTGIVVKGGAPMPVNRPDIGLGMVEVHLVPIDGPKEDMQRAKAAPDGSFKFIGSGNGVKAGKYRLAVYHRENGPPGDNLNGAFSDERSNIEVNLPAEKVGGSLNLGTIDLDQPPTSLP